MKKHLISLFGLLILVTTGAVSCEKDNPDPQGTEAYEMKIRTTGGDILDHRIYLANGFSFKIAAPYDSPGIVDCGPVKNISEIISKYKEEIPQDLLAKVSSECKALKGHGYLAVRAIKFDSGRYASFIDASFFTAWPIFVASEISDPHNGVIGLNVKVYSPGIAHDQELESMSTEARKEKVRALKKEPDTSLEWEIYHFPDSWNYMLRHNSTCVLTYLPEEAD